VVIRRRSVGARSKARQPKPPDPCAQHEELEDTPGTDSVAVPYSAAVAFWPNAAGAPSHQLRVHSNTAAIGADDPDLILNAALPARAQL
jgi:hypothetical protein